MGKSTLDRFQEKYIASATTGCWEWVAAKSKFGYGVFGWGPMTVRENGSRRYADCHAHRFSYTHYKGDIPAGMLVRHACNNPTCVNPDHLVLGTPLENMQDRARAGHASRKKYRSPKRHTATQWMRCPKERVLASVNVSCDGCWVWQKAATKGYGVITWKCTWWQAHRFSYWAFSGTHPKKMHVLHSCDNPMCVNPGHLRLGTNAENMSEKVAKGRHSRGESSGNALLREQEVSAIRKMYRRPVGTKRGLGLFLARWFSVSHSLVTEIKQGRAWRHVA